MASLTHSLILLRPVVSVTRSRLVSQQTTDTTPTVEFVWQGAPPPTVTLDGPGGPYGPYPVVGDTIQVTDPLPPGTYTAISQAENSNGELDIIVGSFEVIVATGSTLLIGPTSDLLIGNTSTLLIG